MAIRRATLWVIECDAPDCMRLAAPAPKDMRTNTLRDKRARALTLAVTVDAFTAAEEAGWVRQMRGLQKWSYYCPDHTDVPDEPHPIRQESRRELKVQAPQPAPRTVRDVHLPDPS